MTILSCWLGGGDEAFAEAAAWILPQCLLEKRHHYYTDDSDASSYLKAY